MIFIMWPISKRFELIPLKNMHIFISYAYTVELKCVLYNTTAENSLVVQWLELSAFIAGTQVQPLVRELRSHKSHGTAKNKNK